MGAERLGFTIIELLVVIAIVAIISGVGAALYPRQDARSYANDVRALLLQGRYEAIKLNQPVSVVWDEDIRAFVTIVSRSDSDEDALERVFANPCSDGARVAEASSVRYRLESVIVEVNEAPGALPGVLWLPTGQARGCDFGVLDETIARVTDSRSQRTITISVAGRVEVR